MEEEEGAKEEEGFEEVKGKPRRRRKAGKGKGKGKGVPLDLSDIGRPTTTTEEATFPPYIATGLVLKPSAKPYVSTPRVSSVRSLAPPGPRFAPFPPLTRGTVPMSGSRPTIFTTRATSPVYSGPARPALASYGPPSPHDPYVAPGIRMVPGVSSPYSNLYAFDPPTSLPGQAGPNVVSQAQQSGTSQAGLGGTSQAQSGMAP